MLVAESLIERIIGLAIEVHRNTGRGLLESVYEQRLCFEFGQAGIPYERQVGIPVTYKGMTMDEGFRADIVVDRRVILEIKAVAAIVPTHEAQLQTYLRMSGIPIGLIFNFNASRLTESIRRFVV
ncbi:MAG TPA: GxxExxY protein [Acetobacteraceae bacterium]|jgi:GxxExxY protein